MSHTISADARSAKLQASYQNLSAAANTLNTASDKFSSAVSSLDEALNRLSPGVTVWITISSSTPEDMPGLEKEERLGFAKTNNRWGLSLSRVTVDNNKREEETTDAWLFNDAPRSLRLLAIDRVPALIEALAREVEQTARKVSESADMAIQLLHSVNAAAKEKR